MMKIWQADGHRWLSCEQRIKAPLAEVFPFFSTARNLERLTPPFLRFRIRRISSEPLGAGALIDYSLTLHHLPVRWRTRIEHWDPPDQFVDLQIRGPFKLWRHTHTFRAAGEDTVITDTVQFNLYCEPLLAMTPLPAWIERDLRDIFEYRQREILKVFEADAGRSHMDDER